MGDQEVALGRPGQAVEQIEAAEDPADPDHPRPGRREPARRVGRADAHDQHADADRDEGGQGSGIGERGELGERDDSGERGDDRPR